MTTYSVHPGAVDTELQRHMGDSYTLASILMPIALPFVRLVAKTPVQGAQTSIYCAVDESLSNVSGKYYR